MNTGTHIKNYRKFLFLQKKLKLFAFSANKNNATLKVKKKKHAIILLVWLIA
jgi:hypothetical protein